MSTHGIKDIRASAMAGLRAAMADARVEETASYDDPKVQELLQKVVTPALIKKYAAWLNKVTRDNLHWQPRGNGRGHCGGHITYGDYVGFGFNAQDPSYGRPPKWVGIDVYLPLDDDEAVGVEIDTPSIGSVRGGRHTASWSYNLKRKDLGKPQVILKFPPGMKEKEAKKAKKPPARKVAKILQPAIKEIASWGSKVVATMWGTPKATGKPKQQGEMPVKQAQKYLRSTGKDFEIIDVQLEPTKLRVTVGFRVIDGYYDGNTKGHKPGEPNYVVQFEPILPAVEGVRRALGVPELVAEDLSEAKLKGGKVTLGQFKKVVVRWDRGSSRWVGSVDDLPNGLACRVESTEATKSQKPKGDVTYRVGFYLGRDAPRGRWRGETVSSPQEAVKLLKSPEAEEANRIASEELGESQSEAGLSPRVQVPV